MARIRTVKPEVYRHEGLYEIEKRTGLPIRLFWIGLFAVCDRAGRFKWRPGSIKLDVLPFDDVDVALILDELWMADFLVRYKVGDEEFGCIPTFLEHQVINAREAQSKIPSYSDPNCEVLTRDPRVTETHVHAHVMHVHARGEGKGRERKGKGREGNGLSEKPRVTHASAEDRPALPDQTPSALIPSSQLSLDSSQSKKPHGFIQRYCDLWAERYGEGYPPITAQDAGIAKRLMKTLSNAEAGLFLEAYFSMPDAWVVKSRHPLGVFEKRLKEIALYARSGAFTTNRQVYQQDDLASNMILLQKVRSETP